MKLQGLYTAVITPFTADGSLDVEKFTMLTEQQIAAGVNGLVVTGSTGEAATLTTAEKATLWRTAVEVSAGRVPVIAGSGSNNTADSVQASRQAAEAGVASLLIVTPYYNKPTPAGVVAHHSAIADACPLPQILYNVPGRTATNLGVDVQLAVMDAVPLVIGSKEASANLSQISRLAAQVPEHVSVLAGDDDLTLPIIGVGGSGVIAVISNYAPVTFGRLVNNALAGNFSSAQRIQKQLIPWYTANFLESNPIPVKYIMHRKYGVSLTYRLPLVPPSAATTGRIDALWDSLPD